MNNLCIACGVEFIKRRKDQSSCGNLKCKRSAWKIKNKEYYNEWQRKYFKKKRLSNPEVYRMYTKNRKHLLRQTSNSTKIFSTSFRLNDWNKIKLEYNFTCPKCLESEPEIKLTIDHILPISKGGIHTKENIQPLCHSCNSGKKDKYEFYPARKQEDRNLAAYSS